MKNIGFIQCIGLLLLFFCSSSGTVAQVVINEASSASLYSLFDEETDASDWIELYNKSSDTLALKGFSLSDKRSDPKRWIIPDVTIFPDSFLLIFASGKNRRSVVDHWETAVWSDSAWRYLNPDYEPHPDWRWPHFCDTAWQIGYGGFGFGDDDDQTLTSDSLRTIYLRKSFFVTDTSQIIHAVLHADYDDGFVLYLNGHELIRENIQPDGKTPHYMQSAMWVKEAQMYQGGLPGAFVINGDVLHRYLHNGENLLAIQCHNRWDDEDMTLKPWLSFSLCDTTRQFGPVPEWFFAPELPLHSNFGISASGENIYLFSPLGHLLDRMEVPSLQPDVSFGRLVDGMDSLSYFFLPSPGAGNQTEYGAGHAVSSSLKIFPETGFYSDSVVVQVFPVDSTLQIRFTLDGSVPSDTSSLLPEHLVLTSTCVFRVRAFQEFAVPSRVATTTYFINDSSTFPVVSVASDPENFWNPEFGIYVLGNQYINSTPYFGANFWDDTEIPVFLELFHPEQGTLLAQDCGLKIHGGWTRSLPQKSLRLMAKGKYGRDGFYYPLFPDKPNLTYKRFVMRNAGNDFFSCFFRDAFVHKLVQNKTHVDILDYQPALVFLNGEYWGIHNLREKIDRYYLASNYGYDPDRVDILEEQGEVIDGENRDFLSFFRFITQHDLSVPANFDTVADALDLQSFVDVMAINIYMVNTDWPHNNMKWWRYNNGKWRYFLLDLDVSTSLLTNCNAYVKQLQRISEDTITANAVLFTKLLGHIPFRDAFINRYADLMNSVFLPAPMLKLTDQLVDFLRPEMTRHKQRWGSQSAATWENYYVNGVFKPFLNNRTPYARDHIVEFFGLEKEVLLQLKSAPVGAGKIRINTLYPDSLPFQGVYFDPVPVEFEALPAPGYTFSHWHNGDSSLLFSSRTAAAAFSDDDTLVAVFTGAPDTAKLLITEFMVAPHPEVQCGDWIELYNADSQVVDLSSYRIKANHFLTESLPEGTLLFPGDFLVLAADRSLFFSVYSDTIPVVEVQGLNLKSWKTVVCLLDPYRNTITSAKYDTAFGWPAGIRLSGRTLDLHSVDSDPYLPESWDPGCLGGSPGRMAVPCNDFPAVVFTEYNPSACPCHDCGDWFEIANFDAFPADLSEWQFRDQDNDHQFVFPRGTLLLPGEYAVIVRDPVKFSSIYPEVKYLGPFDFGLGECDSLILSNRYHSVISALGYSDTLPWPDAVIGTGRTAELISPDSASNHPAAWINGCFGGTPGKGRETCRDNPEVIITEIQYHPHEKYDGGTYFELYNHDTVPVELGGWTLLNRDSLTTLTLPENFVLDTSSYLIFAQNPFRFRGVFPQASVFPTSTGQVFGLHPDAFGFQDPFGITRIWISFDISAPWPEVGDTTGRAIELSDKDVNFTMPLNWFAGCKEGSPGGPYHPCDTTGMDAYEGPWLVYPNPFSSGFYLRCCENMKYPDYVNLMDYSGRIVRSIFHPTVWPLFIETDNLPPGIYLLHITGDRVLKIVKISR